MGRPWEAEQMERYHDMALGRRMGPKKRRMERMLGGVSCKYGLFRTGERTYESQEIAMVVVEDGVLGGWSSRFTM